MTLLLNNYKTIVLPGNGVTGITTLGALQHLCDLGVMNQIENFVGTSSGAIISSLLMMGLRPVQILAELLSRNIFLKVSRVSMASIAGGSSVFNFKYIENELTDIITSSFGFVPTLAQFCDFTKGNLCIVVYNATTHKTEYCTKETHPDIPIVRLLRASAAYPLLFDTVEINGDIMVDGGIGCNFAMSWGNVHFPKPILSVFIEPKRKPIVAETNRLTMVRELISIAIKRADRLELERWKNSNKVTIVVVPLENNSFFDFSGDDRKFITQFSNAATICKATVK